MAETSLTRALRSPSGRGTDRDLAGRMPPAAPEFEQALLGALLIGDATDAASVLAAVPDEALYDSRHQRIMAAVRAMATGAGVLDLVTVTEQLRGTGTLDSAGGAAYLSELTGRTASAANAEYYARIVVERWMLRRFIETATLLVGKAYDPATDAFDLLAEASRDMALIDDDVTRVAGGPVPLSNSVDAHLLELLSGRPPGIPSGLRAIDSMISGHKRGRVYTYAGRPAMGKSAFALGLARMSARAGYVSAYFSLEMPPEEVHDRLLAQESGVDYEDIGYYAHLDDERRERIDRAAARLREIPLHLDCAGTITLEDLVARVKRLHALAIREGRELGLIVVDYLQLVVGRRTSGQSRQEEIASITRALKRLAKDVNAPIVALSQVPRAVENRANKRPTMADLAEGSSIEADSDVVAFLYRPEYYGEATDEAGRSTEGIAEFIVAKNRGGKTGTRRLLFMGSRTTFANLLNASDDLASDPF